MAIGTAEDITYSSTIGTNIKTEEGRKNKRKIDNITHKAINKTLAVFW